MPGRIPHEISEELDRWSATGNVARFWWRDDDAVTDTPKLRRLIELARRLEVRVGLAVIPERADDSLARLLFDAPCRVWQHGWGHHYHADGEFGQGRALQAMIDDALSGQQRLNGIFGPGGWQRVFVPPFHALSLSFKALLPRLGYAGLSAGDPLTPPLQTVHEVNAEVDIVNWKERRFFGADAVNAMLVEQLAVRRSGRIPMDRPIGLLTHHLVHEMDAWRFLEELLSILSSHRAADLIMADSLFDVVCCNGEPKRSILTFSEPSTSPSLRTTLQSVKHDITVVITSCDRHDLLEMTIDSFLQFNTYPIVRFIVVEDGHIRQSLIDKYKAYPFEWIKTGGRIGQIAAIDLAYSKVETDFIFHCEDDWEFINPGFIEKSLEVLRSRDDILQVWIRSLWDTNDSKLSDGLYCKDGVLYRLLQRDDDKWPYGVWHGFSFNPGLRRKRDYELIGSYGSLDADGDMRSLEVESAAAQFYRDRGFHAAILADNGEEGYVRHLGTDRHVAEPLRHGGSISGDAAARSLMGKLTRPPFTKITPFCEQETNCGRETMLGQDEMSESRNWKYRNADQIRIEDYLETCVTSGSRILHVGVGNSSLARRIHARVERIRGLTLHEEERSFAEELKLSNYTVVPWNKFHPVVRGSRYGGFDFIIDNNFSSYACCLFHFCRMVLSYVSTLRDGGAILTAEPGLSHVISESNPEWSIKWDDWSYLAHAVGLRPRRITDFVYSIERHSGAGRSCQSMLEQCPVRPMPLPPRHTSTDPIAADRVSGAVETPMKKADRSPGSDRIAAVSPRSTTLENASIGKSRGVRAIVLGWIIRGPTGGNAWAYLHYVLGLAELGYDVYYIEDCGDQLCVDQTLAHGTTDPTIGLRFASEIFGRLGLGDRWAYYDAHAGEWRGARAHDAHELCQTADLVLNISGVNPLRAWFDHVPARVFVDTDPGFTQLANLTDNKFRKNCEVHTAFFSFGERLGTAPSVVPDDGFPWRATRQPVWLAGWPFVPAPGDGRYTTVMQWDSHTTREWRGLRLGMKAESFPAYIGLPHRCGASFDIAVRGATAPLEALRNAGWGISDIDTIARDPWSYQGFIRASKGEIGIAKEGYVTTRLGWFSERSANYLASGRPVLHQDTGFGDVLPCGNGLFAFSSPEEVAEAIARIDADYESHCRSAREIAEEYFDARHVLPRLIEAAAAPAVSARSVGETDASAGVTSIHNIVDGPVHSLDVASGGVQKRVQHETYASSASTSSSTTLSDSLAGGLTERTLPVAVPVISAAICTYMRYDLLQHAIASLSRQTLDRSQYEILVIDNSPDQELSKRISRDYAAVDNLCWIIEKTPGEANARNAAAAVARGDLIAFLDDDAIAKPGWLGAIVETFGQFGENVAAVGGKVNPIWGAPRPEWLHDHLLAYLSVINWGDKTREITKNEWLVAANLAFRVSPLNKIGGFKTHLGRLRGDQVLLSNCEMDAIDELRARGSRIVYEPNAEVDHLIPASRLSQTWMRRRVVWQAISDYLKDSENYFHTSGGLWPAIADFTERCQPNDPSLTAFFTSTEDPERFSDQMTALRNYTMMMLTGFNGRCSEPGCAVATTEVAQGDAATTEGSDLRHVSPASPLPEGEASDPNGGDRHSHPATRQLRPANIIFSSAEENAVSTSEPAPRSAGESGTQASAAGPRSRRREHDRGVASPDDAALIGFLEAYRESQPEGQREYVNSHYTRFLHTLRGIPVAVSGLTSAIEVGTYGMFLVALRDLFGYQRIEGTVYEKPGTGPITFGRKYGFGLTNDEFILHDIDLEKTRIPSADESFDFLLAAEVIEHFSTDPNAFFFEANRVLRLGSHMLVTTPNVACAENIFRILWRQVPHRYHYYRKDLSTDRHNLEYGPDLLKQTVENAGFAVTRMWDADCWSEQRPEILKLIRDGGYPDSFRGDDMLFLCVKTGQPKERYPDFLYA
jgi:glycosyltransferase involved in cell wall biosynthesis